MKTKEEMALSIENIFKNTKNIHGNSKSIDWIKVASYKVAGYLLFDQISQPSEVMPSDEEMTKNLYDFLRRSSLNLMIDDCDDLASEILSYFKNNNYLIVKSQLKPAEKEEKKIPLVNINPYDLSAIKTSHKSFRK